jgi:ketosteroid isomerase-like protein
MSESLIREMFATIDARDWSHLDRYFTADVVYERPGYAPIRGLPALRDFYERTRIVAAGTHDLWQVIADTDRAACWGRFAGQSRDGAMLDERFADVYRLVDGRIAARSTHFFRPAI